MNFPEILYYPVPDMSHSEYILTAVGVQNIVISGTLNIVIHSKKVI